MENLAIIQAVTDELVRRGYRATMEHPGYVEILKYELRLDFGTANENWDGDVYAGDTEGIVHTQVSSDSTDVITIADAIMTAVEACGLAEIHAEMNRLDWSQQDVEAMFPDLQGEELLEMLRGAEPAEEEQCKPVFPYSVDELKKRGY